nr:3-isopropylmalate dehydratase large subunit [uncultured archaeon]
MKGNLTEKIILEHLVSGRMKEGEEIAIKIDQTLTQDATGTMTYLQFESMNVPMVKTELSVSYIDHNTSQIGFENADDHEYLRTVALKHGILLSKAGNGICHQVHLERFAKPGKTLLGSDSHTPTAGGVGMLAIGAGGIDVAAAMAGGEFYINFPKVIGIELEGRLTGGVSAKDVILYILQKFTTKGNVDTIIEYYGKGVKSLSVPERATITNMGAELGVTSSIFPSDEITKSFLKSQKRESHWVKLKADKNANYFRKENIRLEEIVPMVAKPHSPDNVCEVEEIEGLKVNQVCIGSCTNSSYKDLATVANMLKGKKVHPEVELIIAPASRQVLYMISKDGSLTDLIDAGARIVETACGFCIGSGHSPQTSGISVRTNNRNFKGRSGTNDAEVYLVSPETAAATALEGRLADPRKYVLESKVTVPSFFHIDHSMMVGPSQNPENVKVYKGPNIKECPTNEPLEEIIEGEATIKVGDNITTDHIMPAGSRLKYRSNIPKYAEFVFEGIDHTFSKRAMENKNNGVNNIIIGGESYGQGSSREHAALCPMYLGVKAVIAKSFERIHETNLVNFGIIPLTFLNNQDHDKIDLSDELEIKDLRNSLSGREITLYNKTKNADIQLTHHLSERAINIIKAGGLLNYVRGK